MQKIIELKQVCKQYSQAGNLNRVLQNINLEIDYEQFVAIVGASGNGKSTLLNLLTGIDQPTSGEVIVNGIALQKMNNQQLTAWRGRYVGIVFQFFQLIPGLSLLQNILLPMELLAQLNKAQRLERARYLIEQVGLSSAQHRLPNEVSGGQQQRAAIARALANDPPLIVADEPTGNLDSNTADSVFALFADLQNQGKTLILVTHNEALAALAQRKIEIRAGAIHFDSQQVKT